MQRNQKKELLGNFYREGVTDGIDPIIVNDHDFPSQSNGKVIPHGILDVGKNKAAIHLNASSDTSEFACHSLELWWQEEGQQVYSGTKDILVLCDGGGSNSARSHLFKEDLQALSNRLGLNIRIAHYPPYCSKYNPIEHRLFPHVTHACKGAPLETIEVAKHYMEKTKTTTGLRVTVRIIDKIFERGRKYASDFLESMAIRFDKLLPKWNYTAVPQMRWNREVISGQILSSVFVLPYSAPINRPDAAIALDVAASAITYTVVVSSLFMIAPLLLFAMNIFLYANWQHYHFIEGSGRL